ncbi:MAG: galactokinase [Pseudomonadota bacterium]
MAEPGIAGLFEERFGRSPEWLIEAPGRVNLIGEHTDYNDGFVLPMAINRSTRIAAARRTDAAGSEPSVIAYSADLDEEDRFTVANEGLHSTGVWTDYIKGVLLEFLERGFEPQSFDILVNTTIPIGCGLSSSAALQIAMAKLLQQLEPGLVEDADLAALCQTAEHRFAGTPVGIMDQFCIANATIGHLVYLDCRSLVADHIPFDDSDIAVLITDSKVSRELRDGSYAARRQQCTEASEILGVSHLRDATPDDVERAKGKLGDVRYRRARHITTENVRTTAAAAAISQNAWQEAGRLMYESHQSMANDFEISCKELDLLVNLARDIGEAGGVVGSRMTGGGFGGCTVTLVERRKAEGIVEHIEKAYRDATGLSLSAFVSSPAQGASLLGEKQ